MPTDSNGPMPLRSGPKAFARERAKINELCRWFAGLRAGPGVTVTKSPDATLIGIASGKNSTGATAAGAAISVVGSDGKLNLVPKHSTWSAPSTYPTALGVRAPAASIEIDINSGGIEVRDTSGTSSSSYVGKQALSHVAANGAYTFTSDFTNVRIEVLSMVGTAPVFQVDFGGSTFSLLANGKLVISNGSNTLTIDPALITHDVTLREIAVCNSGTPATMLILGSAPY